METVTKKSTSETTPKLADIYQKVTDTIIQQLEAGTVPWQQPWVGGERAQYFPGSIIKGHRHQPAPDTGISAGIFFTQFLFLFRELKNHFPVLVALAQYLSGLQPPVFPQTDTKVYAFGL